MSAAAPLTARAGAEQRSLFDSLRRKGPGGLDPRERRPRAGGDRLTLERRLDGVWEGLLAAGAAPCPVCSARMHRLGETARCEGCGSELG